MAALPQPRHEAAPDTGPEQQLADVLDFPHQHDGDFSYQPNPVVLVEAGKLSDDEAHHNHGDARLEIVTLANGRHHEVVISEPRRQRSDYPVVMGGALGTSIRGHNWRTMMRLNELGFPVVSVGSEGGHTRWPRSPSEWRRFMVNLLTIDLGETSENMHFILNYTDRSGAYKPGKIFKTGESRDAAVTLGMVARASRFGREAPYGDSIAPCFPQPHPLRANRETVQRGLEVASQIGSIAAKSLRLPHRRALNYARTINLNPHFLLHVGATVPTLLSGKAGQLGSEIPKDAQLHNTMFSNDPWCFPEAWLAILDKSNFPNVTHDVLPGDHGDIVTDETQNNRLARFRVLREELESNHQQTGLINWQIVHGGGRLAVAA